MKNYDLVIVGGGPAGLTCSAFLAKKGVQVTIYEKYNYLVTNKCYWLNKEYNNTKSFALTKNLEENSKIYGEDNNTECSVIPKIIAPKKPNLNIEQNNGESN